MCLNVTNLHFNKSKFLLYFKTKERDLSDNLKKY